MDKARKILIIGPSWVGDMVMAQSLFKTIKGTQAAADITVLAPSWSLPLLARMPQVAAAIRMPIGHGELKLGVRRRLASEIRGMEFDQAIVLPGSFKSALVPAFAKIPQRTGYLGEQRWGLLTDIRPLRKSVMPMHAMRLTALGMPKSKHPLNITLDDIPPPALSVQPEQAAQASARFALEATRPIIALCPGAQYGPAKQWPAQHFAAVARHLLRHGHQVWLFGSANDQPIAAQINHLCQQRCADLTGRTTLDQAMDLMSLATHVVSNDSGLMHIAAAIGCHVIALYGSSSAAYTPPLTPRRDLLNLNLGCSPCFQRTCPLGHLDCLNHLSPEMVLAKLP